MFAGEAAELVGEGGGQLHHPLEEAERALGERPDLDLLLGGDVLADQLDPGHEEGRYWVTCRMRKRWIPCTTRRSEPSGKLEHLVDVGEGADRVEVALRPGRRPRGRAG